MNLYELDKMMLELDEELSSLDQSELTPELAEKIESLLEIQDTLNEEYKLKVRGYCRYISNLTAQMEVCIKESERLKAVAETCKAKVTFLKGRLKDSMRDNGIKSLVVEGYNLSVCQNSTAPLIFDSKEVPSEYRIITVEPDKKRIRQALKRGVDIPGICLGERDFHLRGV